MSVIHVNQLLQDKVSITYVNNEICRGNLHVIYIRNKQIPLFCGCSIILGKLNKYDFCSITFFDFVEPSINMDQVPYLYTQLFLL